MVFLHTDNITASQIWHTHFQQLIKVPYIKLNLADSDSLKLLRSSAKAGDIFIGRINHARQFLNKIKPIYDEVCDIFEDRCFPCRKSMYYYDDKRRQIELLGPHMPKTQYVERAEDINIDFPLVCKKPWGAASTNVKLANSPAELNLPCIVQEFCPGNTYDVRMHVVGDNVMGYYRRNRPNDFRASGSGDLIFPANLPEECIQLAYHISKEHNFTSMCYDMLKLNNKWAITECSYTYYHKYAADCSYYYDMTTGNKVHEAPHSVKFILEAKFPETLTVK